MKIIFVGMHNKPDKTPLCSSTKSGRLIDRIINGLNPKDCIKTNLYDVDYYPNTEEKYILAKDWTERIKPYNLDIIVLLGAEVHNNFIMAGDKKYILKIPHPSSQRSHVQMDEYVKSSINKIKEKQNGK